MDWRQQAYLRHQQARFMRPDAVRWVRPDAAKFLKPGTRPRDVYPALATKYNDDQPRVPAGETGGGQWTSGSGGSGRPRVYIAGRNDDEVGDGGSGGLDFALPNLSFDIGDIASEIDKLDLFDLKPRKRATGGVRLAGKPPTRLPPIVVTPDKPRTRKKPGIGHNGGPPLEPPEIPKRMPDTTEKRMGFVRRAAWWIARAGLRAFAVDIFLGALDQVKDLKRLTDMIKTANDPPEMLDTLRDRASAESEDGYNDHHLVNQHKQNRKKFGNAQIDSWENQVRVPTLVHIEITRWYSTKHKDYGFRPPQEVLRGKDWDEQMQVGIQVLRDFKVINDDRTRNRSCQCSRVGGTVSFRRARPT